MCAGPLLVGFPKGWTPGTQGAVVGEAVLVSIQQDSDFATYQGKLRGKFVLATPMPAVDARFQPLGRRYTDAELADLARQPAARSGRAPGNLAARQALDRRLTKFWVDEGVAAVLEPGRGDGGTFFVQSGGSRDAKDPPVAPQVVLAVEHYGRIARTLVPRQRRQS